MRSVIIRRTRFIRCYRRRYRDITIYRILPLYFSPLSPCRPATIDFMTRHLMTPEIGQRECLMRLDSRRHARGAIGAFWRANARGGFIIYHMLVMIRRMPDTPWRQRRSIRLHRFRILLPRLMSARRDRRYWPPPSTPDGRAATWLSAGRDCVAAA